MRRSSSTRPPLHGGLVDAQRAAGGQRAAVSRDGQQMLEIVPVEARRAMRHCGPILQICALRREAPAPKLQRMNSSIDDRIHGSQAFKASMRAQWDTAAAGWNAHTADIRHWLHRPTDAMCRMAGVRRGSRVLDVAAGSGDQTLAVAQLVGAQGHVLATDLSPAIVALARDNAVRAGFAQVETRVADGEDLGVPEASFDAAVCRLGLMFFPDPLRGLREIHRALRPGGGVCTMVFSRPEKNPCLTILMSTALKHAGLPARDPFAAGGLLSLGQPGRIDALFRSAGFHRRRDHRTRSGVPPALGRPLPRLRSQLGEPDPADPRSARRGCGRRGLERDAGAADGLHHARRVGGAERAAVDGGTPPWGDDMNHSMQDDRACARKHAPATERRRFLRAGAGGLAALASPVVRPARRCGARRSDAHSLQRTGRQHPRPDRPRRRRSAVRHARAACRRRQPARRCRADQCRCVEGRLPRTDRRCCWRRAPSPRSIRISTPSLPTTPRSTCSPCRWPAKCCSASPSARRCLRT